MPEEEVEQVPETEDKSLDERIGAAIGRFFAAAEKETPEEPTTKDARPSSGESFDAMLDRKLAEREQAGKAAQEREGLLKRVEELEGKLKRKGPWTPFRF